MRRAPGALPQRPQGGSSPGSRCLPRKRYPTSLSLNIMFSVPQISFLNLAEQKRYSRQRKTARTQTQRLATMTGPRSGGGSQGEPGSAAGGGAVWSWGRDAPLKASVLGSTIVRPTFQENSHRSVSDGPEAENTGARRIALSGHSEGLNLVQRTHLLRKLLRTEC